MKKRSAYTVVHLCVAVIFGILIVPNSASSQVKYGLSIEAQYVLGTNPGTFYLQDNLIKSGEFHGSEWNVIQNFEIGESPFIPSIKTGFRYFISEGQMNNIPFKVQTTRVHIDFGLRYKVLPQWFISLYYGLENNLELEEFRTQAPDLFRHSFSTSVIYHFGQRWSTQLEYQLAISPLTTHYLLTNPKNLFKAGIAFDIL